MMEIIRGEVTHSLRGHDGERRVSIIAVETARLRPIVPTLTRVQELKNVLKILPRKCEPVVLRWLEREVFELLFLRPHWTNRFIVEISNVCLLYPEVTLPTNGILL